MARPGDRQEPPAAARLRPAAWALLGFGFVTAAKLQGAGTLGGVPWEGIAAVVVAASIPRVQQLVVGGLDALRRPSPERARVAAAAIGALSAAYLAFTAFRQQRGFYPRFHDEYSYIIQTRMLAAGKLWMPAHPMAAFFESFQLLAEPVYASVYFPGTALLYLPSILLHWPVWVPPLLASGAVVGLVYLVVTEIVDGAAGALAALMTLSLPMFRALSIMFLSQTPLLLFGLLMTWAWLEWRRTRRQGWALALGAFSGWAAITRPLDALFFGVPVAAALLLGDLRGKGHSEVLATLRSLLFGAAAFLALQLVFDVGVTGSAFTTPFGMYAERDNPQTSFGFHAYDPARRPASSLPQKQVYYDSFTTRQILAHQTDHLARDFVERRLPWTLAFALPHPLLFALALPGLLALVDWRRLVLLAPFPLFLVGYCFYGFFLAHYTLVVAPALIVASLLGARVLEGSWPRFGRAISTACALLLVVTAVTSFSEVNSDVTDDLYALPSLRLINERLAERVTAPAVVLFTFGPADNPHEEPVYNFDVAWPDDAAIVRAHDLGRRDVELVRYYAEIQPERMFYLYNRGGNALLSLGRAAELAQRERAAPAR